MGGGAKSSSASGFQWFWGASLHCGATILGKNKKSAFTLAEVLITLGIIGVVAAMTLPAVINNTKNKELEAALKKSYSNLSNAIQRTYWEDYNGSSIDLYNGKNTPGMTLGEFMNNLQKYYVKSAACMYYANYNCPTSVFPIPNFTSLNSANFMRNNYKSYLGQNNGDALCNDGIIAAADGSFIFFDYSNSEQIGQKEYGNIYICVDVNGWKKKPNRLGHDFFVFQLDSKNGRLLPAGADGTTYEDDKYCSLSSDSSENGYGCSAKALSDKDYFKNLPK